MECVNEFEFIVDVTLSVIRKILYTTIKIRDFEKGIQRKEKIIIRILVFEPDSTVDLDNETKPNPTADNSAPNHHNINEFGFG